MIRPFSKYCKCKRPSRHQWFVEIGKEKSEICTRENPEVVEITADGILEYLGIPMKSITRADQSRVAQALVELGWEKKLTREGGIFRSSYIKPLRDQMKMIMEDA